MNYIALFRGINVGGHGLLPMKELRALLEGLGCADVRTYIQSGNAVFSHRAAAKGLTPRIRGAIAAAKGFEPELQLLTRAQLEAAAAANPFPEAESAPSKLYLYFLAAKPARPGLATLRGLCAHGERIELAGAVCYLHAPEGIGRSKLAARVERDLGVPATARNWRTVQKLLELSA